jgi:ribonuclease P protein component
MIAKKFRFHGYGSLRFVYTKGQTVRTRFLSLKFHENTRRSESRLAVVVAKKVTKKAPDRNRIRRRLYELMRSNWVQIKSPHDMVITVFDERVATLPAGELNKMVQDLLKQAKILGSKK